MRPTRCRTSSVRTDEEIKGLSERPAGFSSVIKAPPGASISQAEPFSCERITCPRPPLLTRTASPEIRSNPTGQGCRDAGEIHVSKMSLRTFISVELFLPQTLVKHKKAHFPGGNSTTSPNTPAAAVGIAFLLHQLRWRSASLNLAQHGAAQAPASCLKSGSVPAVSGETYVQIHSPMPPVRHYEMSSHVSNCTGGPPVTSPIAF
jgi:hypothetical protein